MENQQRCAKLPHASVLLCVAVVASACAGDDAALKTDAAPIETSDASFDAVEGTPDALTLPTTPFRAYGDRLQVSDGTTYNPIFIAGVNLGVAVPGTQAGELAATRAHYDRWLQQMGEAGINAVRLYTLHYPRFYRAFSFFNQTREQQGKSPIYLLQGVWLDEEYPPNSDPGNLYSVTEIFDDLSQESVHAIHGNASIISRRGRAHGVYDADVSRWTAGWIIGREIYPSEIAYTNMQNLSITSHLGVALSISNASPAETWMTARLDTLVSYEREFYDVERPVSVASWPTLDPLFHGMGSSEDWQQLDLVGIDTGNAPAGLFHSFHAYPYYPDFISESGQYRAFTDDQGPNSYVGYLTQLREHYAGQPMLLAEFGVPSSWGNAHYSHSGMHHGGHDEVAQGRHAARMLRNLYDTNAAGGMFFAWIDEWWKPTWITNDLDFPVSRRAHWHNVTSPEQNFGFVSFDPVTPPFQNVSALGGGGFGGARVLALSMSADARALHLRLPLAVPLSPGDEVVVGIDSYRDDLGESVLPDGVYAGATSNRRCEFALRLWYVAGAWQAELTVAEAYDLFGLWGGTLDPSWQKSASIASDGAPWHVIRWQNNYGNYPDVVDTFYGDVGNTVHEIGRLGVRDVDAGDAQSSTDAVELSGSEIMLHLPWTLLQFTDPSQRQVFHDIPSTPDRETMQSQGVAVAVTVNGAMEGESVRYTWPTWSSAPATVERVKLSLQPYSDAIADVLSR